MSAWPKRISRYCFMALAAPLVLSLPVHAQGQQQPPPQAQPQPERQPLSQQQLQQLVAPLALYPDALLAQVLAASTYPLEVTLAARWAERNPNVKGPDLEAAMQKEPWDPSVKGLTSVPQVLAMMNEKLDWTARRSLPGPAQRCADGDPGAAQAGGLDRQPEVGQGAEGQPGPRAARHGVRRPARILCHRAAGAGLRLCAGLRSGRHLRARLLAAGLCAVFLAPELVGGWPRDRVRRGRLRRACAMVPLQLGTSRLRRDPDQSRPLQQI